MISSEVQRTLVKSPPELWAEVSDPASLAHHLGELGEIRITRTEPEKLVEWEAQDAHGTVAIKASGWGTKVTLTANRKLSAPELSEPADPEIPEAAGEGSAEDQQSPGVMVSAAERFGHEHSATLLGSDLERATAGAPQPEAQETALEPEPEPEATEIRRGFFARLFGLDRRRQRDAAETSPEPVDIAVTEPIDEPADPEPPAGADDEAVALAAELKAAEEASEREVTAILKGVLDRLGAAHHRPFSRA